MFSKIDDLLEERFSYEDDEYAICPYDDNGISLESAITQLFKDEGFADNEFSVEMSTVYSSTAFDLGYVSVAYMDWGKLYHEVYEFESK